MSWWEHSNGSSIGDGSLDITEDFLRSIAREYEEELGRKPHLDEVLACLQVVLEKRADEFADDCDERVITGLSFKSKKRARKQVVKPGDVFTFQYEGSYYYGRVTPQSHYFQFYCVSSVTPLTLSEISEAEILQFPFMVSTDGLDDWTWRIIGSQPFADGEFVPKLFLLGDMIGATATHAIDGFIDVTAALRKATSVELRTIPPFTVVPSALLPKKLREALAIQV